MKDKTCFWEYIGIALVIMAIGGCSYLEQVGKRANCDCAEKAKR